MCVCCSRISYGELKQSVEENEVEGKGRREKKKKTKSKAVKKGYFHSSTGASLKTVCRHDPDDESNRNLPREGGREVGEG
jgi:hypothetical protein